MEFTVSRMLHYHGGVNAAHICSIGSAGEEWAAFYITGVTACLDGSIDITAQFLGCEDAATGGILSSSFGQGGGQIHICTVKPCIEFPNEERGAEVLHATLLRLWEAEGFKADYLIDGAQSLIKKWKSALGKDKPGKRPAARRAPGKGAAAKSAGKTPTARKGRGEEEPGEKKEKKKEKTLGEITAAQKEKLKARLKDIRKKHHSVGDSAEEDAELVRSGSDGYGDDFAEDESSGYAPTEPLDTGAMMKDPPAGRRSKDHTGRRDQIVPYKDTKGGTTKTLSDQLALRALAISRARGDADKKRRKKRSGESLIGALRKALGRTTEEEEGQELQEKKEKAEEVGEWSDSELQRLLWRQLGSGGIGGGRELEFRARSPDEETISGEARECFSTPDRPYQISDGTGRAGGLARGEEGDGRSESGVLLSPAHKECLQLPPERTERDVHVGVCHRPLEKRRRGEGGGRFISKIYSDPPELTGPGVDSGTSHGVVPPGGCISSYLQYGPRHPPPYKTDGEGTRKGQLPLDGLARKRPCSWKGRLVIQRRRRQQRQERKGRSERKRKGQRMAEPRQRQQRVGKDTGQGRRRQVTALEQVPLATAVERTSLRLKDTSIADILMSCSTLGGAGCALAWWLANAEEAGNEWGNVKLLEGVFNPYVWRRARRSRQALPLSVGGFSTVLQVFQSASLETIREKEFVQAHAKQAWTLVGCFTCNALAGSPGPFPKGGWTKAEQRLVSAVERSVDRLMCHGQDTEISPSLIEKELKGKRVNYQGEETCTCHSLTLEQVTAALPPAEHGGSIELTRFLSESSVAFLQQPSKSIVEDTGQELPKLQGKIHIDGSDVDSIAQELVTRGVCRWIPLENVVRFRGELVLNGLFGVEKPGLLPSGKPPLRLIMNLVPSNAIIKDFPGLVRHLPQITSWMSVVMDEGEELRVWQSDMSNAFYLFSLPYNWSPLLAFNIIRNGATLGLPDHQQFALACAVLPMGWCNSVSLMQEASENILLWGNLDPRSQIVRGTLYRSG